MRTSRLAKETSAHVASLLLSSSSPRRTRSSLGGATASSSTLSVSRRNGSSGSRKAAAVIKQEQQGGDKEEDDDASSLSSVPSGASSSFDIEDGPFAVAPKQNKKRKRGKGQPTNGTAKMSRGVTDGDGVGVGVAGSVRQEAAARKSPRRIKSSGTKEEVEEKEEEEDKELDVETEGSSQSGGKKGNPPRRRRRPARKVMDPVSGEVEIHPPDGWEEVYDTTREMRKRLVAAVDTMGCEQAADEQSSPKDQRFQTLIALMLSSQTKDTVNYATMQRLRHELPGDPPGLTLTNIRACPAERLNELIWAVGFHNNKTRFIKAAAEILAGPQHGGDIPSTPEGLMALPGVGPKMAYLCMSAAWGQTVGIGVDVHVHRITNLWGWHKTKGPEETRLALQAWLPQDRWHEINHMLVGLGQTVCLPVGRRCGECDLAKGGLCPGVDRKKLGAVKRVERVVVKKKEVKTEVKTEEQEEGGTTLR